MKDHRHILACRLAIRAGEKIPFKQLDSAPLPVRRFMMDSIAATSLEGLARQTRF